MGTSPDDNDHDDESRRARWRLLDLEDINWAGRRALIFTAAWLVIGVGASIGFAVRNPDALGKFDGSASAGVYSFFIYLIITCATLPTLGAISSSLSKSQESRRRSPRSRRALETGP